MRLQPPKHCFFWTIANQWNFQWPLIFPQVRPLKRKQKLKTTGSIQTTFFVHKSLSSAQFTRFLFCLIRLFHEFIIFLAFKSKESPSMPALVLRQSLLWRPSEWLGVEVGGTQHRRLFLLAGNDQYFRLQLIFCFGRLKRKGLTAQSRSVSQCHFPAIGKKVSFSHFHLRFITSFNILKVLRVSF